MRTAIRYTYYVTSHWSDGKKSTAVRLNKRDADDKAREWRDLANVLSVDVKRESVR